MKENPFSLKFNKNKHEILNKNLGNVTRKKKPQRRMDQRKSKSTFVDKRIGKNPETKQFEFQMPSKDETLTHFGQNVDDITAFPEMSSDEDETLNHQERQKSRNEIITEIIEKSKRYKRERQV